MHKSEKQLSKILSLAILFLLITGVLVPVMSGHSETDVQTEPNDIEPMADDEWLIDSTEYVNSSRQIDSHITITSNGELIINDSTLTLLIDENHPWEIQIWDGGRLELQNSSITTQPQEDLLRPFIKTNISAHSGSEILMEQGSTFRFPGWVYVQSSTFTMRNSSFERVPDDRIPFDDALLINDNNDCPRFTAHANSEVLFEDSEINDYYRNGELDEMEWRTFVEELNEEDGEYYHLEPQDSFTISDWYLNDPDLPVGEYGYVNPYNRISTLYLEIIYDTEENYTASSSLEYNVNDEWKTALQVEPTDTRTVDDSNIWELDIDEFYKGEYMDEEYFLKELDFRLTNDDSIAENKNISVDKVNLISQYNNDLYIRDSSVTVINSIIDVDYRAADTDPRDDNFEPTDDTTWMQDANMERSAIRMINSSFRSFGVYPQDEWDPDGDPFLIADEDSKNQTWYYRWITVTAIDAVGSPLPETNITANLDENYKDLSEALYDNVVGRNNLTDNPKAWHYMNRTGKGYYDIENETFITNDDGQVTLFLISDRVNHPQDWPNTRSVGDYFIEGEHADVGTATGEINLETFPNMNETSTHHEFELVFDEEIPLPDFNVTDEDFRILEDSTEVRSVTRGTELELEATVNNTGTRDAESDIEVVFYSYFEDAVEPEIIETVYLDGLQVGERKTESVFLDTTDMEAGEYQIRYHVDPYDDHDELNTDNNFAEKEITISDQANLQPFELNGVSDGETTDTITDGDEISFHAGIENIGDNDANDVNVSFYYGDGEIYIGSNIIDVPGNGSIAYTDFVQWDEYPGPGEYNITVVVDPENNINETDKSNNELWKTFTILSVTELNIDLQVEPLELFEDETVELVGSIENTGEALSSDIDVYLYVDEGTADEKLIYSEFVPGISGGETVTVDYQWTAEMVGDELSEIRTVSMIIEPEDEGEIVEPREDVEIEIMKTAQISVTEDDISFSTELSQRGDTLEIRADVWNSGGVETTVDVSFYNGFPDEETLIATQHDLVIGPNSSEIADVEWTPEIRGNREIHVIAHTDEDVNNEDNHAMIVKPIFSQDYNNDLIVGGDGFPNEREITGSYDRDGFVVIHGNGELRITGSNPRAVLGLIMDSDQRYSVMLRDQGSLEIDHGSIHSDYQFDIQLEDDSELVVKGDSMMSSNINLIAEDESSVQTEDTTVEGSMEITGDSFSAKESQFTSSDIFLQPSNVDIVNSTFEADLVDFHDTSGTLTGVETGAVEATGESEIELYRWVRATAFSQTRLTIQGAEVTAENLDTDYTVSGTTDGEGITNLKVLTDVIMEHEPELYGNYEFSAVYTPPEAEDVYEIEPFEESLPNYPSQEYVIDYDMHFEDLAIPDLSINENNIFTDTNEINLGDEVRIDADIENVGETEAYDVDVYFFNEQTGEQIGMENIDSIPTEGYTTASVTWTAEMLDDMQTSEDIDISVWIDPEVEPLSDPNSDNNEAVKTLTVLSLPKASFDSDVILLQDGEELTEEDEIVEFDDLSLNIRLTNLGGTDLINGTVNVTISDTELIKENVDVGSGEVIDFYHNWTVRMHGEQNIGIWYNTSEVDQDGVPISSTYVNRTIYVESASLEFEAVSLLETEPGADKTVVGTLVRNDGKPIPEMEVTAYLLDQDGEVAEFQSATTDENGEFLMYVSEPSTSGRYTLSLEADYPDAERVVTGERIEVGESVETGIPLWMIIAVIGAIAAGSVGGIFAYMKIQGPAEWVECGNCSTTIPADVKECPECGVEFETETVKCSECGEWIPHDSEECPECGSQFIKTGKEVQDYEETMKQQYENHVEKYRTKAKDELGDEFTEEEFMDWWQEQPSYITFDEWLEREESRRKEGGIECPECGALNSVDDAICQKCGSTLITLDEDIEQEDIEVDLSDTESLGIDVDTEEDLDFEAEEEPEEEPERKEQQAEQKKVVRKAVKKKPKKVVKKKVKKKPKKKEDEDSE
ncbi:MAG: CARDB domain-containing protein [Thermoplasmatota archaeon]